MLCTIFKIKLSCIDFSKVVSKGGVFVVQNGHWLQIGTQSCIFCADKLQSDIHCFVTRKFSSILTREHYSGDGFGGLASRVNFFLLRFHSIKFCWRGVRILMKKNLFVNTCGLCPTSSMFVEFEMQNLNNWVDIYCLGLQHCRNY
jgi:hypothetical protein